ncbi:hypothetical protein [Empedobacter falsenii]|uniref:Bacteriocin n=1 Tax=Empedobacter falsenii TaxID=343874 RepID=A0AAW7DKJ0_9FLAO|nr:hypothetical protein [Empedobacter falsenii]MDM1551669.1 hypothetical protein [Empedobacter falsenii]
MKNLKKFQVSKETQKNIKGGEWPECPKPNYIMTSCGICIHKLAEELNPCT